MKNSRLEVLNVQAMSISEMRNQNGGCMVDKQLNDLLKKLYQASRDDKKVSEIITQFNKRYDEVCPN